MNHLLLSDLDLLLLSSPSKLHRQHSGMYSNRDGGWTRRNRLVAKARGFGWSREDLLLELKTGLFP
jgi:hypothetical protein